jgi:hypothetical protein
VCLEPPPGGGGGAGGGKCSTDVIQSTSSAVSTPGLTRLTPRAR